MKKNKKILIIITTITIILIVGISLFLILNNKSTEVTNVSSKIPDVVLKEDGVAKFLDGTEVETKVKDKNDVFEVLKEVGGYFKIDNPKTVLKIENTKKSLGFTYYRLSQKYNNIDVYHHELIVAVDGENNVTSITGNYIPIESVNTKTRTTIEEVQTKLPSILGEEVEVLEKNKYIYIKDNEPIYSYVYLVLTESGVYDIIINAIDETLIEKYYKSYGADYTYTGNDIYGVQRTISINKMEIPGYQLHDNNRNISIVNATNIGADTEDSVNNIILKLHASLRQAPAIVNICSDGTLTTSLCSSSNDSFIRNSIIAMHNFSVTYDYYYENLGIRSYDGSGAEIFVNIGVVNDLFGTEEHYNSYWFGGYNIFAFGSKNNITNAAALDIVAHEYTHAVQGNIVKLEYKNESGALMESYADILGSLIEGNNFQIGETHEILRDMTNPNKYLDPAIKDGKYYFPTDKTTYTKEWKEYYENANGENWETWDYGAVHTNSGVANYAAFLMYDNGAFKSKDEMAKIWYNSLFLLNATSDFDDCALAVLESAEELGLSEDKIKIIEDAFITTKMLVKKDCNLSGVVTSAKTDIPLKGTVVTAINKLNPHVSYSVKTDQNGKFEFKKLTPVDYTITFEKSKYETYEEEKTLVEGENSINAKLTSIDEPNYEKAEVVFVLDISGSMNENDPSDVRKQIVSNIVSSLDSHTAVALTVFTKKGMAISNRLSNKSVDKKILITDIFNITNDSGYNENSGTNGRQGLNTGLQLFNSNSIFDSRKYIVFLTDGEDSDDTGPTYDELIAKANNMNVRILTIGLGDEGQINSTILKKIAKETKGKYYHANRSTNLYDFDKKIFEELN